MNAKTFAKSKLPCRRVSSGAECNIALMRQAQAAKINVDEAELAERRKAWVLPANPNQSGMLRKYADQVGPAHKGAVTHAGGNAEVVCYADI
jgi:dihydroxy-acid dehydratase